MLPKLQGNPGDNNGFPSDLYDISPRDLVELIDQHNRPQWYVGLLDTGAMIGVPMDRARIGLNGKVGRSQMASLIQK